MVKVHPGATLTPHFRDFLPGWVGRQPWFVGTGVPSLEPVGYFRFEDPGGEVGIETHLVRDGPTLYQVPMTYRGAPLRQSGALIATAEHSVLGTRWIYDAEADPVWVGELLRLVRTSGVAEPSSKRGVGPAEAHGRLLAPLHEASIELRRVLTTDAPPRDAAGVVMGTWSAPGGTATGCLAVVRSGPGGTGMSRTTAVHRLRSPGDRSTSS
jgi:maltokinase-like protein